jgi:hypothetical protein
MSNSAALSNKGNNRSNDSRRIGIRSEKIRSATAGVQGGLQPLEARELMAFSAHVDFAPMTASIASGYHSDYGKTYGTRGNGLTYGWNVSNAGQGRERNVNSDQKADTLRQMRPGDKWEIAVPNGTYNVTVAAGDPSYTNSNYKINVEGVLTVNEKAGSGNHYATGTKTITVRDGRLTLTNASGAVNNKLLYVNISPATSSSPAPSPAPDKATQTTAPAKPSGLNATASGTSSIKLTWTDNSSRESGFKVSRSTDGSNYSTIATLGANTTSWTNTGLSSNKTYYYKVVAYNGYGTSTSSNDSAKTASTSSTGGSTGTPAPNPGSVGGFQYGMNVGAGSDPNRAIPILKDLGVKVIRLWDEQQTWGNRWAGRPVWNAAKQYHNAGFKVIMLETAVTAPSSYSQAKSFFSWIASQPGLKGAVDYWEIQNEVDLSKYYSESGNMSGYVNKLLKGAWDALHPQGEKVIGGSPIFTATLPKLISAGYNNYCDLANFHFYSSSVDGLNGEIRQVKRTFGSKPVTSTEWNFQFLNVSASTWGSMLRQVESTVEANLVMPAYYRLVYKAESGNGAGKGGLLNTDFSRRAGLYDAFKDMT